jgi:hypothetical protein
MNPDDTGVIIPSEIEACISGVSRVEIEPDKTVSLVYGDQKRVSVRMERPSFALKSNFLALVRRVQNASRANGVDLRHARIT